jgi:Fe2+ transport system protein FeoA
MKKSLNLINSREKVVISEITGSLQNIAYLESLGIFSGQEITIIRNNPRNSAPTLVDVENSRYIIDYELGRNILI